MTDAINAKSDVLGERELDAVSGGDNKAEDTKAVDRMKAFQQLLQAI